MLHVFYLSPFYGIFLPKTEFAVVNLTGMKMGLDPIMETSWNLKNEFPILSSSLHDRF